MLLDPEDLDIVAGAAGASTGHGTTGGTISATGNPNPSMLTVESLPLQAALAGAAMSRLRDDGRRPRSGERGSGNIDVQAGFTWSNANSLTSLCLQ